jgi:hypothetical protein
MPPVSTVAAALEANARAISVDARARSTALMVPDPVPRLVGENSPPPHLSERMALLAALVETESTQEWPTKVHPPPLVSCDGNAEPMRECVDGHLLLETLHAQNKM